MVQRIKSWLRMTCYAVVIYKLVKMQKLSKLCVRLAPNRIDDLKKLPPKKFPDPFACDSFLILQVTR
jgi:hypothetical protein